MKKFVEFAGIDGSGKTTLAQAVAEKVGGVYYKCPPESLRGVRAYFDEQSPQARFHYYLAGNYVAADEIRKLAKVQPVMCDCYLGNTIAAHSVMLDRELCVPGDILLPNHIVFTTAPMKVIDGRLKTRPTRTKYEALKHLEPFNEALSRFFSGMPQVLRVDTSKLSIDESVNLILDHFRL